MIKVIEVKMGGLEIVAGEAVELKTFVGSCVALCLFDPVSKVAGMAHVMLPKNGGVIDQNTKSYGGKYADKAIELMLQNMVSMGAQQARIRAKIAGGASIFSHESEEGIFNIGSRNIAAIKQILMENHIVIQSEDTGENFGRWVNFHAGSGDMTVTSRMRKTEITI